MAQRVYALSVGINDYQEPVRKLTGCLNDVGHFQAFLEGAIGRETLALEVLKDADATRANVIRQFRQHLARAGEGDVAVFHYCGHGAQSQSAGAFLELDPSGRDEGLVLYDSRGKTGGHDLADKELAVLIAEVAERGAHVAFVLDACHSGSGTRSVDAYAGLQSRLTQGVMVERPLDSYLDGHYARMLKKGERLRVPTGRHILLAACDRGQEAKESPAEQRGVFSATLLEVLAQSGPSIRYADLFMRCRAAVRKRAQDQDPQFEPLGGFNAWAGFLGSTAGSRARTFLVSRDRKSWKINCGALQGLPTDPDKPVGVVLHADSSLSRALATVQTIEVNTQDAVLDLGSFEPDPEATYTATISSLPVAPLLVLCAADSPARAPLEAELDKDASCAVALTEIPAGAPYAIEADSDLLRLVRRDSGLLIQAARVGAGRHEAAAAALLEPLRQVAQWERSLALRNAATQLDPGQIDFICCESAEAGPDFEHPGQTVTLESVYDKRRKAWSAIDARLMVRNRTGRPLHFALVYFTPNFGVQVAPSEPFDPSEELRVAYASDEGFHMEEGKVEESVDRFKLIVSTQPIDGFLLAQEGLELGAVLPATRATGGLGANKATRKARTEDWLTKDLVIRVVPRLDELSAQGWTSANGVVKVKGHATLKGKLSMSAARPASRAAGEGLAFLDAFEAAGLGLPSFANTRGDNPNVLEISEIENAEVLQAQPLEIELDLPLTADEALLPFVYDGRHVLLGGDTWKDEVGRTQIRVDHLPDMSELPSDRRSLGGALKMYFFKTYLKRNDQNKLRWIEYTDAAGGFRYRDRDDGLAEKVAAARRVLVMVHGIIGDTEGMAAGLRACGLDQKFDLVLTFDYENLGTPIPDNARNLKEQLAAVGLKAGDDKHLTLLVHSMGGLVSRWFIEREGGRELVDHLVMCGTPNNGSPFGKIDEARQILNVLVTLAANFVPALLPASAPLLFLLNRSKKLTPSLMQMDPDSDFIRELNASPDPGIPYTILAGDVGAYQEPTDALFAKLLAKTGQSALFDALFAQKANDIAVSIDSILRVGPRARAPVTAEVACHHLNYFVSQAGQQALKNVAW